MAGLSHVLVPVLAGFGRVMSYFSSYYLLILQCISNVLKGVGKEGIQTESLHETDEPDLAAANSASLAASAVSYRQIRDLQVATAV